MYPGSYALKHPDRAAFIMASTGATVSYAAFEMTAIWSLALQVSVVVFITPV
jgi:hypothetical protein